MPEPPPPSTRADHTSRGLSELIESVSHTEMPMLSYIRNLVASDVEPRCVSHVVHLAYSNTANVTNVTISDGFYKTVFVNNIF